MILDRLENAGLYEALNPGLADAFAFLCRSDLPSLPTGRHEIDGRTVYAIVARESARPRDKAPLEAHRRYIDVQYVLSGADEMGWRALSDCKSPGGYDAARDIEFFTDEPAAWATVSTGEFAIFFPHDAHAPLTGRGDIHKVVVKVAVADEVRA